MTSKLGELTEELSELQSLVQNSSEDKLGLKMTIQELRDKIQEYKTDEQIAAGNAEDLKSEVCSASFYHTNFTRIAVFILSVIYLVK